MKEKLATANYLAKNFGLTPNTDYILRPISNGIWDVYDLNDNFITCCRTDCFDNYRELS